MELQTTVSDKILNPLLTVADNLPQAFFTLLVGILLIQVGLWVLEKILRNRYLPFRGFVLSIIKFVAWTGLALIVLSQLGFSRFAAFITGSTAILVFFLSTGASSVISDFVSGLALCLDDDFIIGAKVRAGDKGTEGILLSTDMRKVRIRDEAGNVHVIPNSLVEKNEWVVLEAKERPRINAKDRLIKKIKKDKEDK